jgi:hypothetical protein
MYDLSIRCAWLATAAMVCSADVSNFALGKELEFAGRKWIVKESATPVGPGPNRFSANPDDIWVDDSGLHLTIHKHGDHWYSTEVILNESLGYGTYLFQTMSRQDLLDENAVFGAFTWDDYGDDKRLPDYPNREIDFEDSRWGDPKAVNSQIVVQPGFVKGNHFRFELPDLSEDHALTRYFTWSPREVDFRSIHGRHRPDDCPDSAVFHRYHYVENAAAKNILPRPGRENFRFNLWLYEKSEPKNGKPVEVVISDFEFTPLAHQAVDLPVGKAPGRDND